MSEQKNVYATISSGDRDCIVIRRFHSQIPWVVEWGLLETCGSSETNISGFVLYNCVVDRSFEKAKELLTGLGWSEVPGDELPEPPIPDAVLHHQAWQLGARTQQATCAAEVRRLKWGVSVADDSQRESIDWGNELVELCAKAVEETSVGVWNE